MMLRSNGLWWMLGMMLMSAGAQAQVIYYEDFRPELSSQGTSPGVEGVDGCYPGAGGAGTYPFSNGWLLRNVDNRTPDASVSYVNEAWEIREDFQFNVTNCAAFSTSFYAPAGAANDWMWTPLITLPGGETALSWRAVTYDDQYADGYEVRVMTASSGPPTAVPGRSATR